MRARLPDRPEYDESTAPKSIIFGNPAAGMWVLIF